MIKINERVAYAYESEDDNRIRYIDKTNTEEAINGAIFKKGTEYILEQILHPDGRQLKSLRISNNLKLGDVLLQLPFGIVDKQITGIGATTLELRAARNSIIVEPLKAIAYSKANKTSLYVGSEIGLQKTTTSIDQIIKYVKNPKFVYKKFLVVADSLPKVINAIGTDVFKDYFLMIDEVDSFQADSTFRDKMELCLDIYKEFKEENRCLITATMLQFSDPILSKERFLEINFKSPLTRTINLINTSSLNATAAFKIAELHKTNSNSKIVVAYNSVTESLKIIEILKQEYKIDSSIKLMCSKSNRITAGTYFGEIINEILPAAINFLTSAYFTGIDINEDFHCISISDGNMPFTLLSEHKLKQIAGRCRTQLLSENIIYSCFNRDPMPYETLELEQLIKVAKKQVNAINCFESQYKGDAFLKSQVNELKAAVIKSQNFNGLTFTRIDKKNNTEVSYFNIDASLERTRIRFELYSNPNQLKHKLSQDGHTVNFETLNKGKVSLNNDYLKEHEQELIKEALANLEKLDVSNLKPLWDLKHSCGAPIQEKIYDQFEKLSEYLEKEIAIETIIGLLGKNMTGYKNFYQSIVFSSMPDNNPVKQDFINSFKIGETFKEDQIITLVKQIHARNHMDSLLNPVGNFGIKYLNLYFDTQMIRDRKKGIDDRKHKILGLKKFDFEIKKK